MGGIRRHSLAAWALALVCVGILVSGFTGTANAGVSATYKGWGYAASADRSGTSAVWVPSGGTWTRKIIRERKLVYIHPYGSGYSWAWTQSSGWFAMRSADLTTVLPSAQNTGVPAGTRLTKHYGDVTIRTAGYVLDGYDIHGSVTVKAPNVTIRRSIVRGKYLTKGGAAIQSYDATSRNLLIHDVTIVPEYPTYWIEGIKGQNMTVRRTNIHGTVDAVGVHGNNVVLQNNWFHNLRYYASVPTHNDGSHNDAVQIHFGSNIVMTQNYFHDNHNAAVMISPNTGPVSNITISHNWMNGGSCTINVSEKGRGPAQGLRITNNQFGRSTRISNCPIIAPLTTQAVMQASGNTYWDNGATASVRRG